MSLKQTRDRRHTRRLDVCPSRCRLGHYAPPLLPVWLSRARHRPAIVAAMSGTANDDSERETPANDDGNQAEARAPISKEDTRQR